MILRHDRNKEPELNLTPLIDVVFLLLIFFMVSTTFEKESEISIELPEAAGEKSEQERFTIEITIDSEGHYFINEKRTRDEELATLKKALRDVRADHEEPHLILSADRNTPHQAVIRAMDAARQIGLVNLTFATKQTDEK
ncbi:biopolymer transporter ExbD [Thiohalophilus sp.]|uniref:ExbD/TolR family protein n=1 Tax=Thiohalophilus sp. TaxID=3028392 RepID=UPI002ACD6FF9|nr:biopolymer transporter ExbD [Thiohalophilus sp.]MDZ7663088.1 biopolymer transporter ExbD [Thiohalophilus sp.]